VNARALLARGLRLPGSLCNRVVDGVLAPFALWLHAVETGPGIVMAGVPRIRTAPGSRIRIGARVVLVSRAEANPIQALTPCALATLRPGAQLVIGERAALTGAVICAAEHVHIGADTLVGSGALIVDTDFHPLDPAARLADRNAGAKIAPVVIGRGAFIGARAVVLKGTVLGPGCAVGAGAVVTGGTYPAGSVLAGNPARVVKTLAVPDALLEGHDALLESHAASLERHAAPRP
jgi:acetyltransferase-like isoleucine patch superfamily enzyme